MEEDDRPRGCAEHPPSCELNEDPLQPPIALAGWPLRYCGGPGNGPTWLMTVYRTSAPLCPTCREPLELHTFHEENAVVDLCPRCGGVWIDWEDGDFTALARRVPPAAACELPTHGKGSCPRCNGQLAVEVFRDVAEVLRCAECAGAFLPYASIGKIAASTPADARVDERESQIPDDDAGHGLWKRAAARLRAWTNVE